MRIIPVNGAIKDYDWGNTDYIFSLTGERRYEKQAELWFGTHPSGEAVTGDGRKLSEVLTADDLGGRAKLPLLFKVLAIEEPLSLQCHPGKAEAVEGWRREEEARKKGGAVNYMDDNDKPEIICALTPITAMCGFRDLEEAKKDLSSLLGPLWDKWLAPKAADIKGLFMGLYDLPGEARKEIIAEFKKALEALPEGEWDGEYLTKKGIALEAERVHEGDIGCLFPYILNVLRVAPGEGLFLKPDTIHAYCRGNGVELMNASDNVLRCGLTTKRMDLAELSRILIFESEDAKLTDTEILPDGRKLFRTPTPDFRLVEAKTGSYGLKGGVPAFVLQVEGSSVFEDGTESFTLEKGKCAFVSARQGAMQLKTEGLAYFAEVPELK